MRVTPVADTLAVHLETYQTCDVDFQIEVWDFHHLAPNIVFHGPFERIVRGHGLYRTVQDTEASKLSLYGLRLDVVRTSV